jgi:serine/threonine-protein phosphatase 2B catalytic subunit
VLIIDRGNLSLKQYEETEPPYRLPDNLDVFSWSVPFLSEKVINMLFHIIKKTGTDISDAEEGVNMEKVLHTDDMDEKMKRQLVIKGKVSSVAKMTRMFATLREESEMLLQIKNISPDGKLPRGLLLEGKPAIKNGKDLTTPYLITF